MRLLDRSCYVVVHVGRNLFSSRPEMKDLPKLPNASDCVVSICWVPLIMKIDVVADGGW